MLPEYKDKILKILNQISEELEQKELTQTEMLEKGEHLKQLCLIMSPERQLELFLEKNPQYK